MRRQSVMACAICLSLAGPARRAAHAAAAYQARAEQVTHYIQQHFWDARKGLYRGTHPPRKGVLPYAFMWDNGVQFAVLTAAARFDPKTYGPVLARFFSGLDAHWDASRSPAGYQPYFAGPGGGDDRYYDDNAWMAIDFVYAYERTRDAKYLRRAEELLRFVWSGWDERQGGVYWHVSRDTRGGKAQKGVCSSATAAYGMLRLAGHKSGAERVDLIARARRAVAWTRKHLQDRDKLYMDNVDPRNGRIQRHKWTYNTGMMIRCHLLLHERTGSAADLAEALAVGRAAEAFLDPETGAYRDAPFFSHLLAEADLALSRATGQRRFLDRARRTADHYWRTWQTNKPDELKAVAGIARLLWLVADADRPAESGQTLYNGIRLPEAWPPRIGKLSREPMPVPYLDHPPEVVFIDVGRQLFVDDFLIERASLKRTFHRPAYHPASPVVAFDQPWEKQGRAPFAAVFSDGVWHDPADGRFKMWYLGGYLKTTCYATSKDGIRWAKPALDVEEGTNVAMRHYRDSSTVWLDHAEADPARRFKMFTTARKDNWRLALYASRDGVHWPDKPLAVSPPIGDRTTVFYNPFRKVWVWSLRIGYGGVGRSRAYREHPDPVAGMTWGDKEKVLWLCADKLDPRHPKFPTVDPQLYNFDAVAYESLMLGLFSVHQGPPNRQCAQQKIQKRNEVLVGFSRDGFHFHRPDRRPFLGVTETDGDWNWGNVQSAGGGCLVVGEKLYFYVSGRLRTAEFWDGRGSTGLAVLRRDGFASMDAGEKPGSLTTRPVRFGGRRLFVNVDAPQGELRVEVLGADGKALPGFSRTDCVPVRADSTIQPIAWKGGGDLSGLAGKAVRLRFHLARGRLYAFWVSAEQSGASRGYVAAGGPGFTGPTDTVGTAAYR